MINKKNRILLLHTGLMRNLDEELDIFFRDRKFLDEKDEEPKIIQDRTDEEIISKIENEYERKEIISKISNL